MSKLSDLKAEYEAWKKRCAERDKWFRDKIKKLEKSK